MSPPSEQPWAGFHSNPVALSRPSNPEVDSLSFQKTVGRVKVDVVEILRRFGDKPVISNRAKTRNPKSGGLRVSGDYQQNQLQFGLRLDSPAFFRHGQTSTFRLL